MNFSKQSSVMMRVFAIKKETKGCNNAAGNIACTEETGVLLVGAYIT